ncbi:MAG: endonuclease/exonuclease/phosphatase family protein, partial [Rhodopila sp.]
MVEAYARGTQLRSDIMKLISWNLLRLIGASLSDVVRLIEREKPDILLMQEATKAIDGLVARVGGDYRRTSLPNRIHGLAVWSPVTFPSAPRIVPLPSGAMFDRTGQIVDLGPLAV